MTFFECQDRSLSATLRSLVDRARAAIRSTSTRRAGRAGRLVLGSLAVALVVITAAPVRAQGTPAKGGRVGGTAATSRTPVLRVAQTVTEVSDTSSRTRVQAAERITRAAAARLTPAQRDSLRAAMVSAYEIEDKGNDHVRTAFITAIGALGPEAVRASLPVVLASLMDPTWSYPREQNAAIAVVRTLPASDVGLVGDSLVAVATAARAKGFTTATFRTDTLMLTTLAHFGPATVLAYLEGLKSGGQSTEHPVSKVFGLPEDPTDPVGGGALMLRRTGAPALALLTRWSTATIDYQNAPDSVRRQVEFRRDVALAGFMAFGAEGLTPLLALIDVMVKENAVRENATPADAMVCDLLLPPQLAVYLTSLGTKAAPARPLAMTLHSTCERPYGNVLRAMGSAK